MNKKYFLFTLLLSFSFFNLSGNYFSKALAITCPTGNCTPHPTSYPIYSPTNNQSYYPQNSSSHPSSCTSHCAPHPTSYPIYSPTTTTTTTKPPATTTTTTTKPPATTTTTTTTTKPPACCPPVIIQPVVYPVYQIQTPSLDFWADKYTIYQGESVYLRWSSSNVHYCVANLGWTGPKSTIGSELVSPNTTTTYSLTCYGNNGTITRNITINVILPAVSQGEITISKLGRNLSTGERNYSKTVRLKYSEIVEFYITLTNNSPVALNNVLVKDELPSKFVYRIGTTKVNGLSYPDGITFNGLNLNTLNPGETKIITFQAQALTNYGTYTNIVKVNGSNFDQKTDSMILVFPQIIDASVVKTGSTDALPLSLTLTSLSSFGAFYFLKTKPKGQEFLKKIEEKSREYLLEKTRKRLLKR